MTRTIEESADWIGPLPYPGALIRDVIVADTRNWPPGRGVVISPQWIKWVDWTERIVNVGATRSLPEAAPEYLSDLDFSRSYAANLRWHWHYRQPAVCRPAK